MAGGQGHRAWAELPLKARAWRIIHGTWSAAQLACLARIWTSVIRRRRSPAVWAGVAFLGVQGAGLVVGRGNCPVGPLQESWGDPVPLFELVLPPRAAKAAMPVLAAVSLTGIALLVLRSPGLVLRSDPRLARSASPTAAR